MIRTRRSDFASLALSCAALCILAAPTLADSVIHTTVAHFQQNMRADFLFEPFNGGDAFAIPPITSSGNGYAFTVAPSFGLNQLNRVAAFGVGANTDTPATQFTFTGKPVSAFGGTFRVTNLGLSSVGGTISIMTNTGEGTTAIVNPGAGNFFAITTTQPFTSIAINVVPANGLFEYVDDVYVGTSASCPTAADFCPDSMTVGVGAYPFTTVGAGRYLNTDSCNTEGSAPDVYFRFMPAATGLATVDTCGCDFDSILRIFSSCGGPEIACNDDACTTSTGFGFASRVSFRVTAGQPVIVRIAGYNGASGSGTLTIAEHADCAPDYNHSGGLEVQDIFDFLNGWFAGCP